VTGKAGTPAHRGETHHVLQCPSGSAG
jgi:hypothetical protein